MRKKKLIKKKNYSPTGNRTRVFRVTGGDTDHYTIEDSIHWRLQSASQFHLACIYLR